MAKIRVLDREKRTRRVWEAMKAERNRRLAESDWIVARAYERGEPVPEEWARYRQLLRDLPGLLSDEQVMSGDIPWPAIPDSNKQDGGTHGR